MGNQSIQSRNKTPPSPHKSDEKSAGYEKAGRRRSESSLRFSEEGGVSENNVLFTPENIRYLQRTVGNRAVTRLIQKKAKISEPHDHCEREADRVAEEVTRTPLHVEPSAPVPFISRVADSFTPQIEESVQPKKQGGQAPAPTPQVESQINNQWC